MEELGGELMHRMHKKHRKCAILPSRRTDAGWAWLSVIDFEMNLLKEIYNDF
jgi:hypothetical protein